MSIKFKVVGALVIAALISRIAPHYPNFTAMGALAFFGAFSTKRLGLTLTIVVATMMATDLVLNNIIYPSEKFVFMYAGSLYTYLGFAAYAVMGQLFKSKPGAVAGLFLGSLLFFLISNFGVWVSPMSVYPLNGAGLLAVYTAAVPFYAPELLSTLLFSGLALGAESWATRTAKA